MTKEGKLQELQEESTDLVVQAKSIRIKSDPQYSQAAEFLLGVKSLITQIVDHHEPMREKTYAAYQEVLSSRKRLVKPLEDAERIVKSTMGSFMSERQAKQDRIADRIKEGKPGKVREAPKLQGVSTREEWDFTIVNENKVNRDFLMPDERAIRELVKAVGEDAVDIVGGIEVVKVTKIAASRGL